MVLDIYNYLEVKNIFLIRYLVGVNCGIIYVISYVIYPKIKVDSCDSLRVEKTLTFHNTHSVSF